MCSPFPNLAIGCSRHIRNLCEEIALKVTPRKILFPPAVGRAGGILPQGVLSNSVIAPISQFPKGLMTALVLTLFLWNTLVVFADPSKNLFIPKNSRIPAPGKLMEKSRDWRAPKKSKTKSWRDTKKKKVEVEKSRIQKDSLFLYDPIDRNEKWDPYDYGTKEQAHSEAAPIFKFRF